MPSNEIEKVTPAKVPIEINGHGLQLTGLDEMYRWAKYVKASGLAPDTLKTPEAIMVAMQAGLEAGMTPMAALNSIAVVKGRPTWYSKAAKGRVLSSGFCKDWTLYKKYWWTCVYAEGKNTFGNCIVGWNMWLKGAWEPDRFGMQVAIEQRKMAYGK